MVPTPAPTPIPTCSEVDRVGDLPLVALLFPLCCSDVVDLVSKGPVFSPVPTNYVPVGTAVAVVLTGGSIVV